MQNFFLTDVKFSALLVVVFIQLSFLYTLHYTVLIPLPRASETEKNKEL